MQCKSSAMNHHVRCNTCLPGPGSLCSWSVSCITASCVDGHTTVQSPVVALLSLALGLIDGDGGAFAFTEIDWPGRQLPSPLASLEKEMHW